MTNCSPIQRVPDTDYVRPLLGPMATMLQSLQECSQLELALRLLLDSYGSILQHFVSNNMDLSLSIKVRAFIQFTETRLFLLEKASFEDCRIDSDVDLEFLHLLVSTLYGLVIWAFFPLSNTLKPDFSEISRLWKRSRTLLFLRSVSSLCLYYIR